MTHAAGSVVPPEAQETANILCAYWGTRYSKALVNNLYRSAKRYLHRPFNFYCCTSETDGFDDGVRLIPMPDNPGLDPKSGWPSVWVKLLYTQDGFGGLKGPTLVLDIDVLITGDIDCFFDYRPKEFCIIRNWIPRRHELVNGLPNIGNSSVFRFEAGESDYIAKTFFAEMDEAQDYDKYPTEQAFLTYAARKVAWWPDDWVRSWKRHCRPIIPLNFMMAPKLPQNCRILVFHGRPDIEEAASGYHRGRPHHRTLAAPWVKQYFLG
jgi:hypothetical protein